MASNLIAIASNLVASKHFKLYLPYFMLLVGQPHGTWIAIVCLWGHVMQILF